MSMRFRSLTRGAIIARVSFLCLTGTATVPLVAQVRLPDVRLMGAVVGRDGTPVALPATPMHAQYRVKRFAAEQAQEYTLLDSVPRDSLRRTVAQFAVPLLAPVSAVSGVQHHAAGLVGYDADRDPMAQAHFTTWLATPDLPITDRASAVVAQFQANLDAQHPDRVRAAEALLRQIRALGPRYHRYVIDGHSSLIEIYYDMGLRDSVIAHAEQLLTMLVGAGGSYEARVTDLLNVFPLQALAQAYAGLPDGSSRIDRVVQQIRAEFVLTPADRASLSEDALRWQVPGYNSWLETKVARLRLIGQLAPVLQAHAWLNSGDDRRQGTPVVRALADGKVRLLEFGSAGCGPCKEALPAMGRLQEEYRNRGVEVVYVTSTSGHFGTTLMSPEDEVNKLRELYVGRLQVRFQIAVWAGDKVPVVEGGMAPVPSPNDSTFRLGGTPYFVIVDGRGRVRYVRSGGNYEAYGSFDAEFRRVLDFVLKEAKSGTPTPAAALPLWRQSVSSATTTAPAPSR